MNTEEEVIVAPEVTEVEGEEVVVDTDTVEATEGEMETTEEAAE